MIDIAAKRPEREPGATLAAFVLVARFASRFDFKPLPSRCAGPQKNAPNLAGSRLPSILETVKLLSHYDLSLRKSKAALFTRFCIVIVKCPLNIKSIKLCLFEHRNAL